MRIAPVTPSNIDEVLSNLSELSRAETLAFGLDPEELRKWFLWHAEAPFSAAIYGAGPQAIALIVMESVGPMHWRTRFVATREAFEYEWFPLTRFFARFSDRIIHDSKGEIEVLSVSGDPRAADWFLCMGFDHSGTDGQISKFVKRG